MPAKKKARKKAKKKVAGKKVAGKAVSKKTSGKKAAKKKGPKPPAKRKSPKKKVSAPVSRKPVAVSEPSKPEPAIETPPEKPKKEKLGIDCEHCDGTGVCAAGTPYDKSHGQMFGAKLRMTSCIDCLLAAGEHRNSKKLVDCRLCDGDGKV